RALICGSAAVWRAQPRGQFSDIATILTAVRQRGRLRLVRRQRNARLIESSPHAAALVFIRNMSTDVPERCRVGAAGLGFVPVLALIFVVVFPHRKRTSADEYVRDHAVVALVVPVPNGPASLG